MRLMIDGRMESNRFGPGSGVFTYYQMLKRVCRSFPNFSILHDRLSFGIDVERHSTPAVRLFRALTTDKAFVDPNHTTYDIYRLAHLRYRLTGRFSCLEIAGPPGVFHWTFPVPLWIRGWKNFYTIHDTLPLEAGGLKGSARARHVALLETVRARATAIVTVSEYSRSQLVSYLGWSPDEIVNASIAVERPKIRPQKGTRPDGPIVVLGTNGPRKNIEFLLDAYAKSGIRRPIIIAGPINSYVRNLISKFDHLPDVTFLGKVSDTEVSALLGRARCLAFPSLAEGFGLPIVEAMAHRCPVICAGSGAMLEIAGNAALTFAPGDQAKLTGCLQSIDSDDQIVKSLQDSGIIRSRKFGLQGVRERLGGIYCR